MPRPAGKLKIDPPYTQDLDGILVFRTFAEAEISIVRLEQVRLRYAASGDLKGVDWCRRIGLTGRKRAELISRKESVRTSKRLQKAEIAGWFQIWLETPEIFSDWLALRKQTDSFRQLRNAERLDDHSA